MSTKMPLVLLSLLLRFTSCAVLAAEVRPIGTPEPPALNASPSAEYADSARMFQGIPGLERAPGGRLWATWYGGGTGEDKHNYIMLVTSGDDGKTWSQLKLVIDPDRDGPTRAFDPCLWHDPRGKLWLTWAQRDGAGVEHVWASVADGSSQEQARWSTPRAIARGIMMNKPLVTSWGAWLLPVANWRGTGSSGVVASTDEGKTWNVIGAATIPNSADRNCDEHMLIERRDGTLWMLVRTKYGIGESISTDQGRTWPDVQPSKIQHATSRFFLRRLASGKLLLVKHGPIDERTDRSRLMAFLSDDDGRTWQGGLMIDDRKGVSYPDAAQAADGTIYLIYDFDRSREKQIYLATFTEADIAAGKLVSSSGRQRVQINKATGVNPRVKSVEKKAKS